MLVLLGGALRSAAQTTYQVPLGSAAAYGLLSQGDIIAHDVTAGSAPVDIPIQVLGKAGGQQNIGSLVTATMGVFAQSSGNVPLALTDLQAAKNYCSSFYSTTNGQLPYLLAGQTLTAGVYNISGDAVLDSTSPLTISGDTSTVVIVNVTGSLIAQDNSQIVLVGVVPWHVYWNISSNLTVGDGVAFRGVALVAGSSLVDGMQLGHCAILSANDITLTHLSPTIGHNKFYAQPKTEGTCNGSGITCVYPLTGSEMVQDGSFEVPRCLPAGSLGTYVAYNSSGVPVTTSTSDACFWQSTTIAVEAKYFHAQNPLYANGTNTGPGPPDGASVPLNYWSNNQSVPALAQNSFSPTGTAYAAILAQRTTNENGYRSYVGQQLVRSLTAGQPYYAEFSAHISPISQLIMPKLGMAFLQPGQSMPVTTANILASACTLLIDGNPNLPPVSRHHSGYARALRPDGAARGFASLGGNAGRGTGSGASFGGGPLHRCAGSKRTHPGHAQIISHPLSCLVMKSIIIKCAVVALLCLGVLLPGHAQQFLCERVLSWPNAQNGFIGTELLQLQPDSLRLLGDFQPGTTQGGVQPTTTSLRRIRVAACDTARVPGATFTVSSLLYSSVATVTRRGRVLVGNSSSTVNGPSQLSLFKRDGTLRWTRALPKINASEEFKSMLEAPDRGFFIGQLSMNSFYLLRLDSLGNVLWRRPVGRGVAPALGYSPVYTRAGTLLFHISYSPSNVFTSNGVMEVSQNGDSLTTRQTNPDPTQVSSIDYVNYRTYQGTLISLRDGGFLTVAAVDSAGKGLRRPYLTRLDRNLNVVWSTIYRQQASSQYRFSHPYELADGSIVVLCVPQSSYLQTFYLFRYSASGVLLQRYAFPSTLLPTLAQSGTGNGGPGLYVPHGLQPLSDSTFMLTSNLYTFVANKQVRRTYLAHIKVAGLRRVINSTYIPTTNSALATQAPATVWPAPAYPNPASTQVTVPLPALSGAARLTLTDLLGRRVRALGVAAGTGAAVLEVGGLAQGVYLLSLERAGQAPAVQRLTVTGP